MRGLIFDGKKVPAAVLRMDSCGGVLLKLTKIQLVGTAGGRVGSSWWEGGQVGSGNVNRSGKVGRR